jgi:uncharacterized protein
MITIDQARRYYPDDDPAHDFGHVLRVLTLAERLGRQEGADLRVVRAAALLHDIARGADEGAEVEADAETDHALLAARRARGILAGEDAAFVDKLDAIGAVGVARAFAYGAVLGQPLWGEVSPGYVPGEGDEPHTAHHEFHVKLLAIKDRLYTASGRRLAEGRHRFMEDFFAQMAAEVDGER